MRERGRKMAVERRNSGDLRVASEPRCLSLPAGPEEDHRPCVVVIGRVGRDGVLVTAGEDRRGHGAGGTGDSVAVEDENRGAGSRTERR